MYAINHSADNALTGAGERHHNAIKLKEAQWRSASEVEAENLGREPTGCQSRRSAHK